jgi:hypothetical protein
VINSPLNYTRITTYHTGVAQSTGNAGKSALCDLWCREMAV